MTTARLLALLAVAASLPACSAGTPDPAAPTADVAMATASCDEPLPVRDGAATWTLEGFDGGGETQLFSSKRTPVKRCSPAMVRGDRATLDALR